MTSPEAIQSRIFRRATSALARGGRAAWWTDFDGTIAPFELDPESSRPLETIVDLMKNMSKVPAFELGIVTGRLVEFVDPLVAPPVLLECYYGLQKRDAAGEIEHDPEMSRWEARIAEVTQRVVARLDEAGLRCFRSPVIAEAEQGIYVEVKPVSVAFHTAPARSGGVPEEIDDTLRRALQMIAPNPFKVQGNNGNVEVGAPLRNLDKEAAMRSHLERNEFVFFSCDDVADMKAARLVREKGGVVLVVDHSEGIRPGAPGELLDLADMVLSSPADLADFIAPVMEKIAEYAAIIELDGPSLGITNGLTADGGN